MTTSRIHYGICNEAAAEDDGDAIDDDDDDADMMMMMMMMMQLYDNNTAIQLTILLSQTRKGAESRPSAKIAKLLLGVCRQKSELFLSFPRQKKSINVEHTCWR